MNYWDLRKVVKDLLPRTGIIVPRRDNELYVKIKGRKKNYSQFDLVKGAWEKKERNLNKNEIKSFIEVSCRAEECPMPLNLDVWDGLVCPYQCRYCFANYFRETLYNNLFDNPKEIGLRSADPDYIIGRLDKLMDWRGKKELQKAGEVERAIALELPIRFGIRFEDFLPIEGKKEVSLKILNYLADSEYPVMVNTKSDLIAEDRYLSALARNKAGAAVHITLITSNEYLSHKLEAGAPSVARRWWAAKRLHEAGVRVVMRIEPYMVFLNDAPEDVEEYLGKMKEIGLKYMTFDTYSYSASNQSIKGAYESLGYDFYRMSLLTCDTQWLGSLLLSRFMDLFRARGIQCSTFDFGSSPDNDDEICCSISDHFKGAGYSYGNTLSAGRFVRNSANKEDKQGVSWTDFTQFVEAHGGFLSSVLKDRVHRAWNLDDEHNAYTLDWVRGTRILGRDDVGDLIWSWKDEGDFRIEMLKGVIGK